MTYSVPAFDLKKGAMFLEMRLALRDPSFRDSLSLDQEARHKNPKHMTLSLELRWSCTLY